MTRPGPQRYAAVAIALHWSIAASIGALYALGWWMTGAIDDPARAPAAFEAYQLHKSLGLTALVLSCAQIAWRLSHRPPLPPATMGPCERRLARLWHRLLFAMMIALPVSGWLYVSAGWNVRSDVALAVPTRWFGLFQWPHVPAIAALADPSRAAVAHAARLVHESLGWLGVALVAGHAAAALKHHLHDRDSVLWGMLPLLRRPGTED